jgi:murein DD-endopeptidase MepM/ murein hydrolase activator NlpD
LPATLAAAVDQSDVDEACAGSREALGEYEASQAAFSQAALALDTTRTEIETVETRALRTEQRIQDRQDQAEALTENIDVQAAELYMQAAAAPDILGMGDVEDVLTAGYFLESTSGDALETADDLVAARNDLERFESELTDLALQLGELESRQSEDLGVQEVAMDVAFEAYDALDERCKKVRAEYQAEVAARQAAAASQSSGGGSSGVVSAGIRCPFDRGRTQFIDSWGFARSGGRSHKGADMMAAWDEPVYAVESGVVAVENHGIGGKHIWLTGGSGTGYYYAHLNSFAVANGQRVSKGEVIGFNGNSGNAAGGAPHVHFQIHPGGRGRPAVNPYPTLAPACF